MPGRDHNLAPPGVRDPVDRRLDRRTIVRHAVTTRAKRPDVDAPSAIPEGRG